MTSGLRSPASSFTKRVLAFWILANALLCSDALISWDHSGRPNMRTEPETAQTAFATHWRLAEARAMVEGGEPGVPAAVLKPLVTWPAYLIYDLGGVSHRASGGLAWLGSLCSFLLLGIVLRRRFGGVIALLAIPGGRPSLVFREIKRRIRL